jgi:alpha-L-fucosidase
MKQRRYLPVLILSWLAFGIALATLGGMAAEPETKNQKDKRMAWWREARFGMFIHWGVYSVPAGEWRGETKYAEWIMEQAKIPVSRYQQFAKEFNPVKFDAAAWVKTAKDAGMKYLVITSKHHDGFSMWPTAQSDWSIKSSPFQRDPLKELSEECRKQGVRFCVYYSILDWHNSDWGKRREWNDVASGKPDMDRYTAYMKAQLKELVTRYRPGVIWFDGEWESPWTHERGVDLYHYLRALDPDLIINNRVDVYRASLAGMSTNSAAIGDFFTPEQQIPPKGFGAEVDWESCMTLNKHWGFNRADEDWKSVETILRNICDITSKGGNYLLNVGPTSEGLIPQPSVERLAAVGQWMKVNGEAIYGSGPTPFGDELGKSNPTAKGKHGNPQFIPTWNWRCTSKPGKLYVILFNWPTTGLFELSDLKSRVTKAYLLADRRELKFKQTNNRLELNLPQTAPDNIASVVCLEIAAGTAQAEGSSSTNSFANAVEKDSRVQSNGAPWRFAKAPVLDPKLPRVLLVGDSILNGYLPHAVKLLDGKANVDAWVNPYHQSEDFTRRLAQALENGPYDVVHLNTGLHGWQPGRIKAGTFEPLTRGLIEVIRQKCPNAKIVWASSTPILLKGERKLDPELNPIIVEQNRLAAKVMAELKVPVNDLYALTVAQLDLARGDQFHWTTPGSKLMADAVAEAIGKAWSNEAR